MRWVIIALLTVHAVTAVFWAGTTMVLANQNGAGAEKLAYPQLGSATVAFLAGLGLWGLLHRGFGTSEVVLSIGAGCAIAAAGLQSARGLPLVRQLQQASEATRPALQARIGGIQKIANLLLAVALICMVTFRYI